METSPTDRAWLGSLTTYSGLVLQVPPLGNSVAEGLDGEDSELEVLVEGAHGGEGGAKGARSSNMPYFS